jgi:hypothetical protein
MDCNELYYSLFMEWTSCNVAHTNVILVTILLMCYVGKKLWIDVFLKTIKKQKAILRSINVKITVDSKATELSTKRKCE